jgi:outer membrane protein assembly factor BamD (BamD/ComL family)
VKYDELAKICSHTNIEWLNAYIKGKTQLAAREYKEAVSSFKNLDSEFMHKSAEILSSLGTSYYLNGDYLNSVTTFEKVNDNNTFKL